METGSDKKKKISYLQTFLENGNEKFGHLIHI